MPFRTALPGWLSIGVLCLGSVACADVLGINDLQFDRESPHGLEIQPAPGAGAAAVGGAGPVLAGGSGGTQIVPAEPQFEYPDRWASNVLIVADPLAEPPGYRVYDPATGTLETHSFDLDGYRIDETGTWATDLDHVVQFTEPVESESGPVPMLLGYDSVSGWNYRLIVTSPPSFPGESDHTTNVWTHVATMSGGHYVVYNSGSGHYRAGHQDGAVPFVGQWSTGFTHVVGLQVDGTAGVLRFDAVTGSLNFAPLTEEGDLRGGMGEGVEGAWEPETSTHVVPFMTDEGPLVLFYDAIHGKVSAAELSLEPLDETKLVITEVAEAVWNEGLDQIVPIERHGDTAALVYRADTGAVDVRSLYPLDTDSPILK